jgi:hypothetical protein
MSMASTYVSGLQYSLKRTVYTWTLRAPRVSHGVNMMLHYVVTGVITQGDRFTARCCCDLSPDTVLGVGEACMRSVSIPLSIEQALCTVDSPMKGSRGERILRKCLPILPAFI